MAYVKNMHGPTTIDDFNGGLRNTEPLTNSYLPVASYNDSEDRERNKCDLENKENDERYNFHFLNLGSLWLAKCYCELVILNLKETWLKGERYVESALFTGHC